MAKVKSNKLSVLKDPAVKEDPATIPASVAVAVNMTILNTELVGMFNKTNQEEGNVKTVTSEFLVMPTDTPKGGMTIQEVIDGVTKLISDFGNPKESVDKESVQKTLDQVSSGGSLDKIKVELRQIFFYRIVEEKYTKAGNGEYPTTPTSTTKKMEYAINFVITSEITKSTVFNINSISLSIWNTSLPGVLERMQLGNIKDKLK